jgi:hypothetical protein
MKLRIIIWSAAVILAFAAGCTSSEKAAVTVNSGKEKYKMAGGIGASWHAISMDSIDESPAYKWALRYRNSRGSAWGGNPPVSDTSAWNQICRHASWLGLSWIRVEISARMYEPQKNMFDWDNQEMQALYRILDWAEANNADVFLQQMWSNVRWNAYPGVQPLLSAPRSLRDFADGIATLLGYLTTEKKYNCIKWFCITNEPPGGSWGSWWSTGESDAPLTPALREVRKVLDEKNISIPLSGPDWTDLPVFDPGKIDFDSYIGAYDIHSYQGMDEKGEENLKKWAEWANRHNKPLFLSEMGDMRIGWKDSDPGPKSFRAALSNAETVLRGLNAGVSAFNRWSYTNRGDLDGQWQLIRTWDIANQRYLDTVIIEPAAYYGYGIITRFFSKYSAVLETDSIPDKDILSQSLRNAKGEITTCLLNKGDTDRQITLMIKGQYDSKFYLYRVTEEEVSRPGFRMDPLEEITLKNGRKLHLILPSHSISVLTNMHTMHDEMAMNR